VALVRSEDPTKEVSDGSDPPRRGGRCGCPLCERRSSLGGHRGRDDHVAEYDHAEHDDPEHDAAQFGELPEHGLVVRLVELVRRGVRHAGRRVSERSRAALRRRPLRAVTLAALAVLLAGCGRSSVRPTIYAQGPRHVSAFAIDSRGRLWATAAGLTGHENDGLYLIARPGTEAVKVAGGLVDPLGVVWVDGKLLVSSLGKVTAFSGFDGRHFRSRRVILDGPVKGGENNNLALAPNGQVVMGVSASCDHCTPTSKWSASVVSFNPDGTDLRTVASGIRAPFGLAYGNGTLYVTMNQRDDLGDKTPGDWLAVVRNGEDWGFPRCYGQRSAACGGVPAPVAVLDKHAAAGGVALVGSTAYVAEWQTGKVLRVSLETGKVSTLATAIKSPLPVVANDGALLVGDWSSGTISRIDL
jgi:glucose/arabinose dehydrogenase